jgi:hypothetical protein
MIEALKRFVGSLIFWRKAEETPEVKPAPKLRLTKEEIQDLPYWYSLKGLLDRLNDQFDFLRRMRRADPEAYQLYRKIGGYITPSSMLYNVGGTLPATWRAGKRPGFGLTMCLMPDDLGNPDSIHIKAMYYRKIWKDSGVEAFDGERYLVGLYYDDLNDKKLNKVKRGQTCWFYVGVDKECNITPLKSKEVRWVTCKSKRPRSGGKRGVKRHHRHFRYAVTEWTSSDWRLSGIGQKGVSGEEKARQFFCMAVRANEDSGGGVNVRAMRGGMVALLFQRPGHGCE